MAYKTSFIPLLITMVIAVDVDQSTPTATVKSSENEMIPSIEYTSTPFPEYTTATSQQVEHSSRAPIIQPATYILQQASPVQPTEALQKSSFFQPTTPVLQQTAPVFQQASQLVQQAPILQYAIRIAVPQAVNQQYILRHLNRIEYNLEPSQSDSAAQSIIHIVPRQKHLRIAAPQAANQQYILRHLNRVEYNLEPSQSDSAAQPIIHIVPRQKHLRIAVPQAANQQYILRDLNRIEYNLEPSQSDSAAQPIIHIVPRQKHLRYVLPRSEQLTPQSERTAVNYDEAVNQQVIYSRTANEQREDFDNNPQYTYVYDVEDTRTGDIKSQSEQRKGNLVQGRYSVNDPDGLRRTVKYTADPVNGFSAEVRREPIYNTKSDTYSRQI